MAFYFHNEIRAGGTSVAWVRFYSSSSSTSALGSDTFPVSSLLQTLPIPNLGPPRDPGASLSSASPAAPGGFEGFVLHQILWEQGLTC